MDDFDFGGFNLEDYDLEPDKPKYDTLPKINPNKTFSINYKDITPIDVNNLSKEMERFGLFDTEDGIDPDKESEENE